MNNKHYIEINSDLYNRVKAYYDEGLIEVEDKSGTIRKNTKKYIGNFFLVIAIVND